MVKNKDFDLVGTIVCVESIEEALQLREYALEKGFIETLGLTLQEWEKNTVFSFLRDKEIVTSNIYKQQQNLIEYNFKDIFKENSQQKTEKEMEVFKERTIEVNGKLRQVIVSVLIAGGKVHAGYSITHIDDKFNYEIGKKIAKGRALSERTNLVDMEIGRGMDKKFILYSIADHVFRNLENGVIKIKGVK